MPGLSAEFESLLSVAPTVDAELDYAFEDAPRISSGDFSAPKRHKLSAADEKKKKKKDDADAKKGKGGKKDARDDFGGRARLRDTNAPRFEEEGVYRGQIAKRNLEEEESSSLPLGDEDEDEDEDSKDAEESEEEEDSSSTSGSNSSSEEKAKKSKKIKKKSEDSALSRELLQVLEAEREREISLHGEMGETAIRAEQVRNQKRLWDGFLRYA